jgi:hypothetical protein
MYLIIFAMSAMAGYVTGFMLDDHPVALMVGTLLCGVCAMVACALVS